LAVKGEDAETVMTVIMMGTTVKTNKTGTMAWRWGAQAAILAGLLSLVACAGAPVAGVSPPQVPQPARSDADLLWERAQAYWQARMKDDMPTAYTFEDPVRRKQFTLIDYIRNIGTGMKLTAAEVSQVKIDGDLADVSVELQGRHTIPGWQTVPNMRTTLIDDWQKIDGQWVHVINLHVIRTGKPRVNPDGTVTIITPGTVSPAQRGQ